MQTWDIRERALFAPLYACTVAIARAEDAGAEKRTRHEIKSSKSRNRA
jgi:hypothetical protein